MAYIGTEPKDVRSFGRAKFDYTASQGQTAFTGTDDDGKTLGFTDGQIEVFVNGILMDESDFSTSNGNTVTLASAANLNDIISITALQTDIPNSDYVPATGGTFTGDVDFGSNKITYANLYAHLSDLPSASTYHGMFAHVHATGLAYYAHAGAWIPLANLTGANFTGDISTTGKITTTNQPAFKAYAGGGWTSFGNTNNNLMPFDTASPNVGNHYNTSTKRFTAPVAGTYFFYGQWYSDGNTFGEIILRKNGSAEVAYGIVRDQGAIPKTSVILSLSANDYVEMIGKISNTDTEDWYAFTSYSFFQGYLLG